LTNNVPKVSEAEWEVMMVLWQQHPQPQPASVVISYLGEHTEWKPKTVRTLLDRLVQKKVVGVNKDQRVYTFFPLYSQDDCQRAEAKSFIQRIYGDTFKSLLIHFIEEERLTDQEIKELRSILDEKPMEK